MVKYNFQDGGENFATAPPQVGLGRQLNEMPAVFSSKLKFDEHKQLHMKN